VLDILQAADMLGVSRRTLSGMAARGEVPARKVGREWWFPRTALIGWLRREVRKP
jgi:excisionase family DNA binding protein